MGHLRKLAGIALTLLATFFAVVSILSIWEVIKIEDVFAKSLKTLLVIFITSGILLFIFAVIYKSDDSNKS
jgi:uncharacterized membrane protein